MRVRLALVALCGVMGFSGIAGAEALGEPDAARGGAAASAEDPLVLSDVRVESRDGRERVVLELSRAPAFRVVQTVGNTLRLEVRGASLASGMRQEIGAGGATLVQRVRVVSRADRAVIEVDVADGVQGTAVRAGQRILWLFRAPPRAANTTAPVRTIAREQGAPEVYENVEETDSPEVAAFLSDVPLQVGGARDRRRYSGRRVDLDFHEADIHNILRLLAEVGGVNIVTSDDVEGNVTIRMRNVPWDQALDIILQAKGLGMVRRDNLIRVAPLVTLEREREAAIARLKQQEQLAPLETRILPVSYAYASMLSPKINELLTDRGSVSIDERTNVLIVRDIPDVLDNVEELVRALDTQTPQVLIEARIVEATSQYSRDVGIQWGGDVSMSSATGNPTGLVFPSNVNLGGGASGSASDLPAGDTGGLNPFVIGPLASNPNFAVNMPAVTGLRSGGALGLTLGSVGGNVNLSVRLSAAEATGNLRIISSPRILTLDNHEASIAQGTLIPYSVVSAQGINTAFREAKLELKVTPHVTSDGSVLMHVEITRDEPDFSRTSTRGDPTILKREAETTLLIPDGNTAVIGGIYTRTTSRNLDQVPFFGDIPVIGVLFQRRRARDDRNELLIFLTPRIVNRAESIGQ